MIARMLIIFAAVPCLTLWSDEPPASLQNIARGVSYTVSPKPNYGYCTDPGDAQQLTDGVLTEGHFWTQPSTVGWQAAWPIYIVLDLGSIKPISGLSYRTAAGVAGVSWPESIALYVADTENAFHSVGDLVTLDRPHAPAPPEGYGIHRYWTDALKTHGRYVALIVWDEPYSFVDEIEVYAGDSGWTSLPFTDEPIDDLKVNTKKYLVRRAVLNRIADDSDALRKHVADAPLASGTKLELTTALDGIASVSNSDANMLIPDKTILPLNPQHQQVFGIQARYWQAIGRAPITLWRADTWAPLDICAEPPTDAPMDVAVHLMRNEYRAAAFNIANARSQAQSCEVRLLGLPGGDNPSYITVHKVEWTDTKHGGPVAAALPFATRHDDAYMVDMLPAGLVRQIWLTFHPVDIEPGEYHGTIEIKVGGDTFAMPLTMTIHPWQFPEQPRLHCGGWDYTDTTVYGVTQANRGALIQHLREHFVDSPWGSAATMPLGQYDGDGRMTATPDTTHFDNWIARWPAARQYCVFAAVGNKIGPCAMGTPAFDLAVGAWTRFWAAHARAKGIASEQIALLTVDEPSDPKQDEVILAWARAIHTSQTGFRVWEDPIYSDMSKALPEMIAACDVLCPNRPLFLQSKPEYREFFVERRKQGSTLEFYSCSGPARLLDPYAYYRLQAWSCWQYGATASYFWAFGDTGGASSWSEYLLPASAYCPMFLDAESVTPGKQMEAIREGIEDYEYLAMLAEAVAAAEKAGDVGADTLQQARTLLTEEPQRICEPKPVLLTWHQNAEHGQADTIRIRILQLLAALHYAP